MVVGIGLDVLLLMLIEVFEIKCKVTPYAIMFGLTYAGVHALLSYAGVDVLRDLYPLVMGVTALIAVMEGIIDGYGSGRRDFKRFDRPLLNLSWIPGNSKVEKT